MEKFKWKLTAIIHLMKRCLRSYSNLSESNIGLVVLKELCIRHNGMTEPIASDYEMMLQIDDYQL